MGPALKEYSVLKLVHPGGLVEIHTTPITADEVMKKNPKHCVARPDVFKYPWIVVRPESVLKPGSIFYIVPHHTMRKLMLKAHERENEHGKEMIKHTEENVSVERTDKRNLGKSRGTLCGNKQSRVGCEDQSEVQYSSVDLTYFNSMQDMPPLQTADKTDIYFKSVNSGRYGSKADVPSHSDSRHSCEEIKVRKERNQQVTTLENPIKPINVTEIQRKGYLAELQSTEVVSSKDPYQIAEQAPDQFQSLEKLVNNESDVQHQRNIVNESQVSGGLKSCMKPRHITTNTTPNLRVRFMLPGDEEKIMRTKLWLSETHPITP